MSTSRTFTLDHLLRAIEPASDEPAWQWVAREVEHGSHAELKRPNFDAIPMSKWVIDAFQMPHVRNLTCMVSAQSGKTQGAEYCLLWMAKNDPADAIWYEGTKDDAKSHYKTRLLPAFENCAATNALLPSARSKTENTLIQLDSMNLHVLGAHTKRNRERITAHKIFCDEVRHYPKGAVDQIRNRFKTVRKWLLYLFSTAGVMNDDLHLAFEAGSRTMPFWTCPHCQHKQVFRFGRKPSPLFPEERKCGGFVWEDSPETHPEPNRYDWPKLKATVRYECENPDCKHLFRNADKHALIATVEPIDTNPNAPRENKSFWWWEAYMPFEQCSWENIVEKWLKAQVAKKLGNIEPMKVFIQESLGEPWKEISEKIEIAAIEKRKAPYLIGAEWPPDPNQIKLITVDVQKGYLIAILRQWKRLYGSRLIRAVKLNDWGELERFQKDNGVENAGVFIDSGHGAKEGSPDTARVYDACLAHGKWIQTRTDVIWDGWMPMKGDEAEFFHTGNLKVHWKVNQIDHMGRTVPLLLWSNPVFKTRLYLITIQGGAGVWEIPSNVEPWYLHQLQREEVIEKILPDGATERRWKENVKDNHAGDCELEQFVAADYWNVFTQT